MKQLPDICKKEGYPTKKYLQWITEYDIKEGVSKLIESLEENWEFGDWGFKLHKKRYDKLFRKSYIKLELHTGGWSGNEDIIHALVKNTHFWNMYWYQTTRGGHHIFRINVKYY